MFPYGICVMLSFLTSYGMYIPLMVLVSVHSCANQSKQWDTRKMPDAGHGLLQFEVTRNVRLRK